MNTLTKVLAVTTLLASVSTATLAQVSVGGGVESSGSVSVDAGGASVDAGATGSANANENSNAGGNGNGGANGDAGGNAGGSINSSAGGNGNGSSASGSGELNYGTIISGLRTSSITMSDIEALDDDVEVEVVTLSELKGNAGENASALDQAVNAQSTSVTDLQTAIESDADLSAEITSALEAEGNFDMDDVVAITFSAEGDLMLIVDDTE